MLIVAIGDLSNVDIWILIVDTIIIAMLAITYYNEGNSFSKCRKIEIDDTQLNSWRFFLYVSIITTWIIAYLIFAQPYPLRHFLHLFFLVGINHMLEISIPAYVCKRNGFGGTCNCDFYKYNDFKPMLVLGIAGNLLFTYLSLDPESGLILLGSLLLLSLAVYNFMPERELLPLKYPPYLLISGVDELQEYLMTNPKQRKLLIVLDAKCDFCEIQVDEIMRLSSDLINNHLRIYDLTFAEEMDPIIPMYLNMNSVDKIPVPTTFIFDSGMAIEQKDGVLSKTEIQSILTNNMTK